MLLVSTKADLSLPLFFREDSTSLIKSTSLLYDSESKELEELFNYDFSYIYFRDPFNDETVDQKNAKRLIELLFDHYGSAYYLDGISSYEDMLLEDKWEQYKLFGDLMPSTELLSKVNTLKKDKIIIKKRISARSKGVFFDRKDIKRNENLEKYIIQQLVRINKEYRVYVVAGKIIGPLAIKSSKSKSQHVRIIGEEKKVPAEILDICRHVYEKTNYDFMGIDIAETATGFKLLEINRSCQFKAYLRTTGINLAATLNKHLLNTKLA